MADIEETVRALLGSNEPEYQSAVAFGPEVIPILRQLSGDREELVASKAVYFASLVPTHEAIGVIDQGLKSESPEVRAAAASGLRNLPKPLPESFFEAALGDGDPDVRQAGVVAMLSAPAGFARERLERFLREEPLTYLKDLAAKILDQTGGE